jgi:hypothetical protein
MLSHSSPAVQNFLQIPAPEGTLHGLPADGLTENENRASPENENEILLLVPSPGHAN